MKFHYEIAPIKIIRAESDFFTYASAEKLAIGSVVEIPVGKRKMVGVVWQKTNQPDFETREILRVISAPLPEHILRLAKWMSEYYATPLAQVLSGILPSGISKNRRQNSKSQNAISKKDFSARTNFLYNEQQVEAIEKLDSIAKGTVLLHGITGSGKTEIYINQAKKTLEKTHKSAIILVPEIALTSQLVSNFEREFSNIKIIHSRQTEAERHKVWLQILNEEKPQIVIGARSALFAPVRNLGLIVIDECHEPSFKQENTPKYSALRASSFLASEFNFKAIFGSATPLIEDYFLAKTAQQKGGNDILELTELAKKEARKPKIEIVNLGNKETHKHRFFSNKLLAEMKQTLAENKQVLLYHNRRGSASTTLCQNCGWQALCQNCFLPMTLHADKHRLICHICGKQEKVPLVCPVCGEPEIIHKGIGTKMIEEEAKKLFPNHKIARFDADSENDKTVEKIYSQIVSGEIDILIGTQVIAKGLDLPKLKTVGVIQADAGLALPDFTSRERNFQLLAQVAGRVGRHSQDSSVIVQTYQPEAESIQFALNQDFSGFYNFEIRNRERQNYPPFVYLLKLTCVYKTEGSAVRNSQKAAREIRKNFSKDVQIFGPTPAFYERIGETYRWQIVIKSKKRAQLLEIAREFQSKPQWRVDLDPPGLI
ncbi:MAG: primosomal protein N' [bacterium]|nr:primosomal protein N' [bacterium]